MFLFYQVVAVYVTAPSMEEARMISRHLVNSRLVACVNIIPSIVSVYEWNDKVEEASEVMMMIKVILIFVALKFTSFIVCESICNYLQYFYLFYRLGPR